MRQEINPLANLDEALIFNLLLEREYTALRV
jgi:hypothetical protein